MFQRQGGLEQHKTSEAISLQAGLEKADGFGVLTDCLGQGSVSLEIKTYS